MPGEPDAEPTVNVQYQDVKKYGEQVAAYFIGPKAENLQYMSDFFNEIIVKDLKAARDAFHEEDKDFITTATQDSKPFQLSMARLSDVLTPLSKYMGEHNIPFYSPRYMAHMACEPALPALLGYMLTMFYNPNNVAAEASPLTTMLEYHLGQDLCQMLGYRRRPPKDTSKAKELEDEPVGWGHITPGGSIANLEAMWAARNLKFYTLALKNAMTVGENPPLAFVYPTFKVKLCTGETKLFKECSTWELLNLKPYTILSFADDLAIQYGISSSYVEFVMNDYIIQTTGKDALQKQYDVKPPVVLISYTNHYSWPKSAAILGIGSENLIHIPVDKDARMDIDELDKALAKCMGEQRAVYQVVAIIGSTEIGSVDPVGKMLGLRKKYETMGLSFAIHADGAWGGYFTSILRKAPNDPLDPMLSALALSTHTFKELSNLKDVDSITLDPHKSGYCPYPGGGLCYRDERMRFLVTWTSPYLDGQQNGVESIGTFGVAGSTPGAAPVSAWVAAAVIGLHNKGYGALLSTALFTAARLWCHWATIENNDFFTVPFNRLPTEKAGASEAAIKEEKEFIRNRILHKSNEALFGDHDAINKLRLLGSDLMINAYATNFKIGGVTNTNVNEANYFNKRIFGDLSVLKVADDVDSKDVLIMATSLSQKNYGEALRTYKDRLGLDRNSDEDLYVLVNVSMSPFPTQGDFVGTMAKAFEKKAQELVKEVQWRNLPGSDRHSFVVQGTKQLYFTYVANLHTVRSRQQTIITGDVPAEVLIKYNEMQGRFPGSVFTLHTADCEDLEKVLEKGTFKAVIDEGVPNDIGMYMSKDSQHSIPAFDLTNIRIIKHRSLDPKFLDQDYPEHMPFYLYGSLDDEVHMDHILRKSPNIQLSSSKVELDLKYDRTSPAFGDALKKGVIVELDQVYEKAMQPFTSGHQPIFFDVARKFEVKVYADAVKEPSGSSLPTMQANRGLLLAIGSITLGSRNYKDFTYLNTDPVASLNLDEWMPDQEEFGDFLTSPTDVPWDEYHLAMVRRENWRKDMLSKGIGSSNIYQGGDLDNDDAGL